MPRYFFHIMNSRALIDTEGTDLPDLQTARDMAIKTTGSVIASEGEKFWEAGKWRLTMVDEEGIVHLTVDVAAFTHEEVRQS